MTEITIRVEGIEELQSKFSKAGNRVTRLVLNGLHGVTSEWSRIAKKEIRTGSRTGVYNPRTKKRRSAPGEYPKRDTGNLDRNIGIQRLSNGSRFESKAEYSNYLEFGTRKTQARPFMIRTVNENKDIVEKKVNDAVTNGLRNAGLI